MSEYTKKRSKGPYKPRIRLSTPGLWRSYFKSLGQIKESPCSCTRILKKSGKRVSSSFTWCPATKFDPEGWFCNGCGKGHIKSKEV